MTCQLEYQNSRAGLQIGRTAGPYRVLAALGIRTAGEAYKAEHLSTKRIVVLKVITSSSGCSDEALKRFQQEIDTHARLNHPNIAAVYSAFVEGDQLIVPMEYVEGRSLRDLLADGTITPSVALKYMYQILSALDYAHDRGIVHRDVTPDNIRVTADGTPKLTDFGLATNPRRRHTPQTKLPLGSCLYMSPEQVHGDAMVSAASDLYSVGAILYEIVTGRPPFDGNNSEAIMMARVEQTPVPPADLAAGLDARLNALILTALERSPAARFCSADEFMRGLAVIEDLGIKPAPAPVQSTAHRKGKPAHLAVATSIVGAALVFCMGVAFARSFGGVPETAAAMPPASVGASVPVKDTLTPINHTPAVSSVDTPSLEAGSPRQALDTPRVSRRAGGIPRADEKPATIMVGGMRPAPVFSENEESAERVNEGAESDAQEEEAEQTTATPEAATAVESQDDSSLEAPEPPKKRNRFLRAVGKIFRRNKAKDVE